MSDIFLAANIIPKIGHFGISKLCKLKQNEIYGKVKENDIFASGLILFTIHVGIPPYEKSIQNDRLYQFLK
jgi:hypothetical protein